MQPDGSDSKGLYWLPVSAGQTKTMLDAIRTFGSFLEEEGSVVTLRHATKRRINWLGKHFSPAIRRNHSLLAHLSREDEQESDLSESIPLERQIAQGCGRGRPIAFPKALEVEFFSKGLLSRRQRDHVNGICPHTVRDTLYFLLLMYGGLRKSEPLHVFLSDVAPDPEQPGAASRKHRTRRPRRSSIRIHRCPPNQDAFAR